MYENAYNDKGLLVPIRTSDPPDSKVNTEQKGFRDELLCLECENRLSKIEGYAKKVCLGIKRNGSRWASVEPVTDRTIQVTRYDFQSLKKFILSLFWRASVSTHRVFEKFDLGPYEKRFQQLIFGPTDCTVQEFPVLLFRLNVGAHDGGAVLVYPPRKVNGKTNYEVCGFGFGFHVIVDPSPAPSSIDQTFIGEDSMMVTTIEALNREMTPDAMDRILSPSVQRHYR